MRSAALLLSLTLALPASGQETVSALLESYTNRVAPRDSAVWFNRAAPLYSFVYAADARDGVLVFDILGYLWQRVRAGPLAAIDLRQDFPFADGTAPLVAAAGESGTLQFYRALPNGRLQPATTAAFPAAEPRLGPLTALAMHAGRDGSWSLYQGFAAGEVIHWRIDVQEGDLQLTQARTMVLEAPVAALVADDALGTLFVASGDMLWRFPAAGYEMETAIVDRPGSPCMPARGFGSLALYPTGSEKGWLVAGERGGPQISIYRRERVRGIYDCVATFTIGQGLRDAVEEITSLEIDAVAFGQLYPRGLLVVGDGADDRGARNLKLVSWERVIEALGLDALN